LAVCAPLFMPQYIVYAPLLIILIGFEGFEHRSQKTCSPTKAKLKRSLT
jgi:hypothetical protein